MTSASRETLRCVTHRTEDEILVRQFAPAVGESLNLFLLSVAVEASCFARVLTFVRCVTLFNVLLLVTPFSRRLCDKVRDRLHCIADFVMNTSVYLVVYGGLLVKTTTQKLPVCLFICV